MEINIWDYLLFPSDSPSATILLDLNNDSSFWILMWKFIIKAMIRDLCEIHTKLLYYTTGEDNNHILLVQSAKAMAKLV